MTNEELQARAEALGPAERIINMLLTFSDHLYHNRPGLVRPDATKATGVRWDWATYKTEEGVKVAYLKKKQGRKTVLQRVGTLDEQKRLTLPDGTVGGRYQEPGLFPEVAEWMYRQVAEVYKLDNEFAARWASYAANEDHRDLKVILAAFMLVQSRYGAPVKEGGEVLFHDADYREVGEAMVLRQHRRARMDAKMLYRVFEVLRLPAIAEINRDMGFGISTRRPPMGRYTKAIEKWLRQRERNPKMLEGLVNAGYKTTVKKLSQQVGYKPETPNFFRVLRWKQGQHPQGHRTVGLDEEMAELKRWSDLSEKEVCERILKDKPEFKRLVGQLAGGVGTTRAVMAAAIEAGIISDADFIIMSPTLEDLGLLEHPQIKAKWEEAMGRAKDMRAANVAKRMRKTENRESMDVAAAAAAQKEVSKALNDLFIYVAVDISGSMERSIVKAKDYLKTLLAVFPLDKVCVATFNSYGRKINIQHASRAGVEQAFMGIRAGGLTFHGKAFDVFEQHPAPEGHDVIVLWVGDQGQYGSITDRVQRSSINPVAFGLLDLSPPIGEKCIERTAANLGIPCFPIDENMFAEDDSYAVPRTIRNLIEAAPAPAAGRVAPRRETLVEQILKTPLLERPAWAGV